MNRRCVCRIRVSFGLLAILVVATGAAAQQQATVLMTSMAANARQLKQYTFKQRTEMYHKGELKNPKLVEVHYDASGERVSIPLDEQKAQSKPRRRGPGRGSSPKRLKKSRRK